MKTIRCERCEGQREYGATHEVWECVASLKKQRDEALAKLAEVVHCSNADCSHNSVVASVPCVFCRHKETKAKLAEVDAQVQHNANADAVTIMRLEATLASSARDAETAMNNLRLENARAERYRERTEQLEAKLARAVEALERLTGVIGEEDCELVHALLADLAKPEGT